MSGLTGAHAPGLHSFQPPTRSGYSLGFVPRRSLTSPRPVRDLPTATRVLEALGERSPTPGEHLPIPGEARPLQGEACRHRDYVSQRSGECFLISGKLRPVLASVPSTGRVSPGVGMGSPAPGERPYVPGCVHRRTRSHGNHEPPQPPSLCQGFERSRRPSPARPRFEPAGGEYLSRRLAEPR
jgi:hypothetical protein